MSEYRDLSRLPKEQAYWDDLEARVLAGLAEEPVIDPDGWWSPLAMRAGVLGGFAAAAALAALLLLPTRTAEPVTTTGLLRIPESNPALAAFVTAETPPALTSLMLSTESLR